MEYLVSAVEKCVAGYKKHFLLVLEPPVNDGHADEGRLGALLLRSLLGQAHTLLESIKRRRKLGVLGPTAVKADQDINITPSRVLSAINQDLSSFPGFGMWKEQLLKSAPLTYSWPVAPSSSRYILKRRSGM